MRHNGTVASCAAAILALGLAVPLGAQDHDPGTSIQRGLAYLRTTQNPDGSWSPQVGPAITGLVLTGLLNDPGIGPSDPAAARAIASILSKARPDGGIHEGFLPNYNTAICLSALSEVKDRPDVDRVREKAISFLRDLQWQPGMTGAHDDPITKRHPFYGGAGYGKHGRPDLSNTHIMLQGLHDAGVPADDPAYQRAIVFIHRLQGVASNELHGRRIVQDGGFIYATSVNKDLVGVPQSMASPEQLDEANQGRPVSGLRTYGSMTYAGFKSYLYANLARDDHRVQAALGWIRANYTLGQNPGMPEPLRHQGLYYYFITFARALDAWGEDTIKTPDGTEHRWRDDLVQQLVALQRPDGSWVNEADRWMEGDPNLVTAYSVIALQIATK